MEMNTLIKLLVEARGELGGAIAQSGPQDDQIIMDHVRNVYTVLGVVITIAKDKGDAK